MTRTMTLQRMGHEFVCACCVVTDRAAADVVTQETRSHSIYADLDRGTGEQSGCYPYEFDATVPPARFGYQERANLPNSQ